MHVHVCRVGLTVGQGGLPQKASILNFRPNSPQLELKIKNKNYKIKNKYRLKSENLNYNSQIFILTSLFLHSISSSINASSNHYCCCYSFPQRSGLLLACCCCSSSNPWSQSHTVNLRNFSPLSISYIFFFCLCYIALPSALAVCPLPSAFFYEQCWLYLWVVAFIGLVCNVCSLCLCQYVDRRLT